MRTLGLVLLLLVPAPAPALGQCGGGRCARPARLPHARIWAEVPPTWANYYGYTPPPPAYGYPGDPSPYFTAPTSYFYAPGHVHRGPFARWFGPRNRCR